MVEELKLAIKIDDASIEQSLLKQFANAQKMADKVVLDFKNVNFDDKQIEAKFKEMQKKAGQNPIDLTIGGNTLDMLGQIDKRLTEIFSIGKGKSFIDSSSTVADIGKIENKINELNKKYEEMQKKLSSVGSEGISGKDVSLIDNAEFQKLSQEVSELKNQFDDLKAHMQLLDDYTVPTDRFFELQTQIEATSVKVSDLVDEMIRLSNIQKNIGAETNISSENGIDDFNTKLQESKKYVNEIRQAFMSIVGKASNKESLLNQYPELGEFKNRTNIDKARSFLNTDEWKDFLSTLPQAHTYLESIGYDFDRIYKLSDEEIKWFKDLSPEELLSNGWYDKKLDQSQLKEIRAAYQNTMKDAFPDKDISASVESATNSIKEENNILEQNTQKVKENTQAKEENANANLNKYDKRLDSYNGKVDKYQATIDRFNDGGWSSSTYLEKVQAVRDAVKQYATLLDNIKTNQNGIATDEDIQNLDNYEKKIKDTIATVTNMSASEKGYNFVSGQKELDKIHKLLAENSKMSSEAKAKIRAYYAEIESGNPSMSLDKIHGEILKIYNAEVEAGRAGKTLWDTLKNSGFHQIAAQMAGMFGVYDVINLGKEGFNVIKDLDYALVDLKKTTSMNESQLESYYYSSNDVAKQMGVTTEEIIDQSSAWSRLGYNTAQASKTMAELSSQFASISPGMDTTTSQEGLVSIMKAWDIDYSDVKSEIMDNINALGNSMAEDNQDIVEGMERSAAALAAVGTSYEDAFAMFSGIQEVLQNAEVSGRALRSISMRIRGYDESTEELSSDLENITGDLIDLTKTAEHTQGVSIFKDGSTTEFKSLVDYFGQINQIWDEMSQKQQNDFLQKAFGKTQAQAGAALIQNYSAVTKSLKVMEEAAGSSDREMDTVRQSITYKLNNLEQTWVGTVQNILDRGDLGTIVDGLTKVSEAVGFLTSNLGLLGTAGNTISGILGAKGLGLKSKFTSQPL